MLSIPSEVEGKRGYYGDLCKPFENAGFHLCGNWEYYKAFFDTALHRHEGVTIYLRLPVRVVQGKLDRADALLEFERPFLIKHIVHVGLIEDDSDYSALDPIGLNQFQEPLDPDDRIEREDKWRQVGERAIDRIKSRLFS